VTKENNEEDIKAAKVICEKYLEFSKTNIDSAYKFTTNVDLSIFKRTAEKSDSVYGKVISYNYLDGTSKVLSYSGKYPDGEFVLNYKLKREKINTTRTIFLKQNKDTIKVVNYTENAEF
jgi:hypothetical protein